MVADSACIWRCVEQDMQAKSPDINGTTIDGSSAMTKETNSDTSPLAHEPSHVAKFQDFAGFKGQVPEVLSA
jgi:hypothetical protein